MEQALGLAHFWSPVSLHRKRRELAVLNRNRVEGSNHVREQVLEQALGLAHFWSPVSIYIEREENPHFKIAIV